MGGNSLRINTLHNYARYVCIYVSASVDIHSSGIEAPDNLFPPKILNDTRFNTVVHIHTYVGIHVNANIHTSTSMNMYVLYM